MHDALGTLDRVDFIVKMLGMVNATPDFNDLPKVINGCSDLFVEVFGDAGRHARSAVGNVMLPNQISVEIEGYRRGQSVSALAKPGAESITPADEGANRGT